MTDALHQTSLLNERRYSIDTCVLVEMWSGSKGAYPRERFTGLWDYIERKIEEGIIIAHKEVYEELKRHSSKEFQDWLRNHQTQLSNEPDATIPPVTKIINEYLSTFKNGYRPDISDAADSFVVGLAMSHELTVFTQEKRLSPNDLVQANGPKIPNICDKYNVPCVDINQFMEIENITLVTA